jgi:hypothetical protein
MDLLIHGHHNRPLNHSRFGQPHLKLTKGKVRLNRRVHLRALEEVRAVVLRRRKRARISERKRADKLRAA